MPHVRSCHGSKALSGGQCLWVADRSILNERQGFSMKRYVLIVLGVVLVLSHLDAAQAAPGFSGTGQLAGGNPVSSGAFRVSDDGQTVIGESYSNLGQVGFRWTKAAGIQFVPMGCVTL